MEFLYTRFINLITSEPSIRTVLPLKAQGIEDQTDEIFTLTTGMSPPTHSPPHPPTTQSSSFEPPLSPLSNPPTHPPTHYRQR